MTRPYIPRRSSARWLVDAPDYVLACYDLGEKIFDRYTILIGGRLRAPGMGRNVECITMSESPMHPLGLSQFGDMPSADRGSLGRKVRWLDLPQPIRTHIISRCVYIPLDNEPAQA